MAEYIAPLIPNMGLAEQAFAGSAEIILTAADREIIKDRTGGVNTNKNFTKLVKEMFENSLDIDKAETGEKNLNERENPEIRIKLEKHLIMSAPAGVPHERVEISGDLKAERSGYKDYYMEKEINIEDEYAVLYGQKLMGIPISEERINHLEEILGKGSIDKIKPKTEKAIHELLNYVIKESLYEKLKDVKLALSFIIKLKQPKKMLDFYLGKAPLKITELVYLMNELKVPILKIKELYNMETVTLTEEALQIEALLKKETDEIKLLEECLRQENLQMLLSDNIINRLKYAASISMIKAKLENLNVGKDRINEIINEAKRIAWLKSVVILKNLHLKRVLCNSKREFEDLSRHIKDSTIRARKLGLKISRDGVKWIEAKLSNMALNAADYKINLLRSMQEMSHDKQREHDIEWLGKIISHLKKQPT